ncbi:MAG: hypothetical protein ACUZ8H_06145 [Candidatus Anammoxibacter sp.]
MNFPLKYNRLQLVSLFLIITASLTGVRLGSADRKGAGDSVATSFAEKPPLDKQTVFRILTEEFPPYNFFRRGTSDV